MTVKTHEDAARPTVRLALEDELAACQRIRRSVFVEGQGVDVRIEVDGLDGQCDHFIAEQGGAPVGTARLRVVDGLAKAERVAVLAACRGRGAGRALMRALEAHANERGFSEVVLYAQEAVIPFYRDIGYDARGERFYEAGIPHREMRKRIP